MMKIKFFTIFAALLFGLNIIFAAQAAAQEIEPLVFGKKISRIIKGGETLIYSVELKRGNVLRIDAEQFDCDVILALGTTAGVPLGASDFGIRYDRESISYIAEIDMPAMFAVRSQNGKDESGKIEFTATLKENAVESDFYRPLALEMQWQALKNFKTGTAESYAKARKDFEELTTVWHKLLNEDYWQVYALNMTAMTLIKADKPNEALPFLNQALTYRDSAGSPRIVADTYGILAGFYLLNRDKRKTIDALENARTLADTAGDKISAANYLRNLAALYKDAGEKDKWAVYSFAAEMRPKYDNPAELLDEMATYQKTFGNFSVALEACKLAADYARIANDKEFESYITGSMAEIYISLELYEEALKAAQKSLETSKGNVLRTSLNLARISEAYLKSGETRKALEYAEKSLSSVSEIKDRASKAAILNNAGAVYTAAGNAEKAVPLLKDALLLNKTTGYFLYEADTLSNLMRAAHVLENDRAAIFYGKQSVNILQNLRSTLKNFDSRKELNFGSLEKNTQKSFLKSAENSYKTLAEILIGANRLSEAHEVLTSLKDQQFLDFEGDTEKVLSPLSATLREAENFARYEAASEKIGATLRKLHGYNYSEIGEKDKEDVRRLEAELEKASKDFSQAANEIEKDFSQPVSAKDAPPDVAALKDLQIILRETDAQTNRKSAAVFQNIGKENFSALIVTADKISKIIAPANGAELNKKAKEYWAILQSDKYDPTEISKQIYDAVFAPVEKELPAETKNILWSLDGNLRYVPPAALFDGKHYLAERFQNALLTRADGKKLLRPAADFTRGIGFGTDKAQTVNLFDERVSFDALPGVQSELKSIFRADGQAGIIRGEILLNENFNRDRIIAALKRKPSVVHIASHFAFRPGDERNSFLLTGDGGAFTLEEMKKIPSLFEGVELLTLSACNTAAQQPDATGKEVDGFAELAQRLGANSVMASLWAVSDESTALLMSEFYRLKKNDSSITKSEAIQIVQKMMLEGKIKSTAPPKGNRSKEVKEIGVTDTKLFKADPNKPFAHPFYWSPFVLIGNWR